MTSDKRAISGSRCLETIVELDGLGVRFAGTRQEQAAAQWIENRLRKWGLSHAQQQTFPCLSFSCRRCRVAVRRDGKWKPVKAEPAAHSRSTAFGGIELELVVLEQIPSSRRECRQLLRDRAVLVYSSKLFQYRALRRVMQARPGAVLIVDDRFPNDWTVAVGFPRYWIDFIQCPVVNIPYMSAWNIVREQASEVRLEVDCRIEPATSQNVLADLPGRRWPDEIIIVSAHHDSVLNNPGADDNLSGVAALVELARYFSAHPPGRTLRFISYGTEEQLSEGARHYTLNAKDLGQTRFVLNNDAVGAWMGTTGLHYAGAPQLARTLKQLNRDTGFPADVIAELSPFSDHFPLNLAGVPSVWYYRTTYAAARHYHHSALETPQVISPRVMERTVRHQALLLEKVANPRSIPFPTRIPASQMRRLKKMGREWCGETGLRFEA